ncbi:segregation/condensation protein A [Streptomyces sp. NBC_01077]|uniref:segregation and condensation protein A n=1 Tax=Streptomyces sp. NBC_01077 TaxID=2903746 RepID=UPI00386BA03A|nr:segregation/condensation protein A [Streptomyces sp. NBC_01077]
MHHASDETSRPPRRRLLGRGPVEAEGAAVVPPPPAPPAAAPVAGVGEERAPTPPADLAVAEEDGAGADDRVGAEADGSARPGASDEPGPEAAGDAGADHGAGTEPAAGPEPEAELEPEPAAGPEPGVGLGAAPEAEPEPEPAAGPEPGAGLEPAAGPEPGAGPGAAPDVESEPPAGEVGDGRFTVRLANFEGPFDLLLQLITKHKLDVTEVALSQVTDEFMAHLRALGPDGDLDQTTEFLVVAATLLDLKAARLLPAAEVEDEADLALLEARDLLFARLLQYRAYKRIATIFEERWEVEGRRHPRTVGLEPHHAELLPEVVISIGAEGFARLAVKAMQPKPEPQVYVDHIHAPLVSVREQAAVVVSLLRERGTALFRELIEDVGDDTLTVVARFLALLELYREKAVALDQETALGDLTVSWTGGDGDGTPRVTDEFDQETTA